MYADLTLPANTWHSWISEATSTGDHAAIISAAQGDYSAIDATLDRMSHDGELADILPALVDWSREAARTAA